MVEDNSVISEESDNMKLFLVLVLATVAVCYPNAPAAPAYLSYNSDIIVEEAKKTSRTARKAFPQEQNQYGSSGSAPVASRPPLPSLTTSYIKKQIFGGTVYQNQSPFGQGYRG